VFKYSNLKHSINLSTTIIKKSKSQNIDSSLSINRGHKLFTCFCHANTTVNDGEGLVDLVRDDPNEELWLSFELALVRKALKSDLIQSLPPKTTNPILNFQKHI
jgi:hypothetical protein